MITNIEECWMVRRAFNSETYLTELDLPTETLRQLNIFLTCHLGKWWRYSLTFFCFASSGNCTHNTAVNVDQKWSLLYNADKGNDFGCESGSHSERGSSLSRLFGELWYSGRLSELYHIWMEYINRLKKRLLIFREMGPK